MKQTAAILLAVLVFAVAAKDLLMWSSFKYNQDFIAKTLCVNRDEPEKKCNGKCHLKKKIAEAKDKTPTQAPVPQPDEQKQVLNFNEIPSLQLSIVISREIKPNFTETTFTPQFSGIDIFQPPRKMA